jgi:hypothetical protein
VNPVASDLSAGELRSLLRRSDRTAAWLARQVGMSRTQVARWMDDGVPIRHEVRVRGLLMPLPEGDSPDA